MTDLATLAAAFAGALRLEGVGATPEQAARFARAVRETAPIGLDDLYVVARPTLVTSKEQYEAFDRVFGRVFGALADPADQRGEAPAVVARRPRPTEPARRPPAPTPRPPTAGAADLRLPGAADAQAGSDPAKAPAVTFASREELLARTDFAELSEGEIEELAERLRRLGATLPLRRTARLERRSGAGRIDLRATIARSRRHGGEAIEQVLRQRRRKPRRLVMLLDSSGSMKSYALAYLHWMHGAAQSCDAEVFAFATRLTRLTQVFRERDPRAALERAAEEAPDWHGGTRIGEAMKTFLDVHGRRGTARGAVVVVISDGWERDDPALLGQQMERLARLAHRVVWVNPRKADPRYEPLTAGMAAALPHCDAFVSGHSAIALGELLGAISDPRRPSRARAA